MIFAGKIWLLGLLALPVLLLIYLIFKRRHPALVSSLMLWEAKSGPDNSGLVLKKRPLPLSFWLEALIVILLALAAAGPLLPRAGGAPPLTVILDNSFSMLASPAPGAPSPRDKAADELRSLARTFPGRLLRIIMAGTGASFAGAARGAAELEAVMKNWSCRESAADIPGALALSQKLSRGAPSETLILTDGPPPEKCPPPGVIWRALGTPLSNSALTGASRSADGPDRCAAVISSFCKEDTELTVSAKTLDGAPFSESRKIKIAPGAEMKVQFKVPPGAGTVKIETDDKTLDFDNSAVLPPARRPKVRVSVRLPDRKTLAAVSRAVESSGNMELSENRPELVICGAPQKNTPGAAAWEFVLRGAEKGRSLKGPFTVRGDHPLLSGIDFGGVIWGAPEASPLTGRPLISAGSRPLLTVSPRGALAWNVSMERFSPGSTLDASPAWPSMLRNLGEWIIDSRPGLPRSSFRTGERITMNIPDSAGLVEIELPGEGRQRLTGGAGRALSSAREPGAGALFIDGEKHSFHVNPLCAAESDLSKCASGDFKGERLAVEDEAVYLPLSFALTLAALGLIVLHQYLFLRRTA
jgi:hypothetical protein